MNDRGFETVEDVLTAADCERLSAGLGESRGAGRRHCLRDPRIAELARRPELLEIARRWIGPGALPYRATLFDKSGARNWLVAWHQDTALPLESWNPSPEWGPWSLKEGIAYAHAPAWALEGLVALRIHLDPSTSASGPLRVIPGSHRLGVLPDAEAFRLGREGPSWDCVAGRGSVFAMRPLLLHGSSKAAGPARRRVLHVEYAPSLDLGPGLRLAVA